MKLRALTLSMVALFAPALAWAADTAAPCLR